MVNMINDEQRIHVASSQIHPSPSSLSSADKELGKLLDTFPIDSLT